LNILDTTASVKMCVVKKIKAGEILEEEFNKVHSWWYYGQISLSFGISIYCTYCEEFPPLTIESIMVVNCWSLVNLFIPVYII
jgi:hypothetical protein